MIRCDARARTLSLSVRDLAEEGDWRFAGPAPLSLRRRAQLGRAEHEAHQEAREEALSSYKRERAIRFETQLDGWTALVTGRIDGIYSDAAGRTVIEEVKTIVGGPADLAAAGPDTFPAYARQLQLYRYLLEEGSRALSFAGSAPEIALHLYLIALPGREARLLELPYAREACREHVERRLRALIEEQQGAAARGARRRAVASEIRFPHPELRAPQEAMLRAVDEALAAGRPALVSAPPGVGKTAAALVPALRRALAIGGRVFVATSKTTQQAIVIRTLGLLREAGTPVRAVVLQAREKACLNRVVDCRPEACEFARDYAGKLHGSGAFERLLEGGLAEPAALKAEAERERFCPFEAALDLTGEVDVVVGDYNYAFDPGASLRRMFVEEEPRDVVLVIDEAHNLLRRGVGYYSPELPGGLLRELDQVLVGRTDPLSRRTRDVLHRLRVLVAETGEGQAPAPPAAAPAPEAAPALRNRGLFDDPEAVRPRRPARAPAAKRAVAAPVAAPPLAAPPRPLPVAPRDARAREVALDPAPFAALRDELDALAVEWFALGGPAAARGPLEEEPLLRLQRLVGRFAGVLDLGGEEFSGVWRADEGGSLKLLCKDPSRLLGRRIRACAGAVGVSATLEPLPFYRDVLGFPPETALVSLGSPFDPRRRRVMVLHRPSTHYHERERDLPIVEDAVRAVVAARRGNYLVCCPSFEYQDMLARRLEVVPGFEVVGQARSMDEARRAAVLERMAAGASGRAAPLLLLAVQGGIFTEGVDYPGELCVGAIVIGPGLPQVDLERELMQRHYEGKYGPGRGFEYAYLYPGMSRVVQAAGRVIRTPTDRGVVVLVGSRFATSRYTDLFPRDWYVRSPRELISTDPYGDLVRFWAEVDGEGRPGA